MVVSKDGNEEVLAENIIIAAGSIPLIPQMFAYDKNIVCSSTEALEWTNVPDSLLIVGRRRNRMRDCDDLC